MTAVHRPDARLHDPRDRGIETRLLDAILAGSPIPHPEPGAYSAGVTARLDQRGDTIRRRPIDTFLREMAEEALDLGGWAILAAQHPRGAPVVPTLVEVATYGAAAHAVLTRHDARR